jgi:DNA-binding transcriptional MerR regulator
MSDPAQDSDAAFDAWLRQSNKSLVDATGQALDLDRLFARTHRPAEDWADSGGSGQPLSFPVAADQTPWLTEDAGYRGPAACQIAGIAYRQLDYWARTRLVPPTLPSGAESGSPRLYTVKDILILKIVKRLLDTGVAISAMRVMVEHLRDHSLAELTRLTLFSDGTAVYECKSPDEVVDLLQSGRGLFGIALSGALQEITAGLDEFRAERVNAADDVDHPAQPGYLVRPDAAG